jgi:mono/diheme cytochrome c family protein
MILRGGRGVIPSFSLLFVFSFLSLVSCTSKSGDVAPAALDPKALAKRGRAIYQSNCTACHNSNPHKVGSLGPDVYGSSKELLEARILKGAYPPGYTPKRETHVMAALPHLKGEIDALFAYLNSAE